MLFKNLHSFNDIFEDYYAPLVAFANKLIHDLDMSEDLIQDLFVSLYEKNESIKLKTAIKPYLFKAAYNRCMSHLRKVQPEILNDEMENAEFRDLMVETEFEARVYAEIQKLPDRCREIFTLNRFEDLSNDEIAEKLDISKRTVETQISKALKILRSSLDPKTFYTFFM